MIHSILTVIIWYFTAKYCVHSIQFDHTPVNNTIFYGLPLHCFSFFCVFLFLKYFIIFLVIVSKTWNFAWLEEDRISWRMGKLLNLHECKHLLRSHMFGKHFLENRHIFIDAQTTQRVAISDWWNVGSLCCYDELLVHGMNQMRSIRGSFPFLVLKMFCSTIERIYSHPPTSKHTKLNHFLAQKHRMRVCALITSAHPSFGYASPNYVCTSAMNCLILMEGSLRVIKTKMIQMHPAPIHHYHPLIWSNIVLLQ